MNPCRLGIWSLNAVSLAVALVSVGLIACPLAHAETRWTLQWEPEQTALDCEGGELLHRAIDEGTVAPPNLHVSSDDPGHTVRARASRSSAGYTMQLILIDATGAVLGERVLNDRSPTCEQLVQASALALQLMLAPFTSHDRELATPERSAPPEELEPGRETTRDAPSVAPPTSAAQHKKSGATLLVGGVAGTGLAGTAGAHGQVRARLEVQSVWPVEAWFTGFGRGTVEARAGVSGALTVTPYLLGLTSCPLTWNAPKGYVSACAGVEGGLLSARGAGFTLRSARSLAESIAAVISLPAGLSIGKHALVSAVAEVGFPFVYTHFDAIDATGARRTIWKVSPVYGTLSLLAGWSFR